MKLRSILTISALLIAVNCFSSGRIIVKVVNSSKIDRHTEMVEIDLNDIQKRLELSENDTFVITSSNEEVTYQITSDNKVIFPVKLAARKKAVFKIRKGQPSEFIEKVCGAHYPKRVDDIAWENDLVGFRTYGYDEDKASGYDIFVKRATDLPAVREMYRIALDPELKKIQNKLKKVSKDSADRFNYDHRSFHVDHGYGADCYAVGPTLGAGVAALLDGSEIIYPFCYEDFKIIDNGPLRFTLQMNFRPFNYGGKEIQESRIISLDLGSYLNKTIVTYSGLEHSTPIVTGIVLQDTDEKCIGDSSKGYIAYPAPTMNYDKQREVDNGTIYVGNAFAHELTKTSAVYFSKKESKKRGNSAGHILAYSEYDPETPFIYYWGAGWNHSEMKSYDQWIDYLETFTAQLRNPLTITIK